MKFLEIVIWGYRKRVGLMSGLRAEASFTAYFEWPVLRPHRSGHFKLSTKIRFYERRKHPTC
jgi:hypothetical protein